MTAHLANTPVLETERLLLRAPEISDYPVCEAFVCSERASFILAERGTPRVAWRDLAQMAGMWHLRGFGPFVFCDRNSGEPLGLVGPWHPMHSPEREIAWSVWTPEAEGRGYAFEAALAARHHAYHSLGWSTAVSYIAPENSRSLALAGRMGCTLDENAPTPDVGANPMLQVWRHPAPEALQ